MRPVPGVVRLLTLPVNELEENRVSTVMATAMTMMAENMEPITLCLVRMVQELCVQSDVSDDQFLFKKELGG